MKTWTWLYSPEAPFNWRFIRNVVIKTALLFVALNVLFALTFPLPALGKISLYNVIVPGRERLPYSDNPDAAPPYLEQAMALAEEYSDPWVMNSVGWDYMELEDCESAVAAFERALQIEPDLQDAQDGINDCNEQ